MASVDVLALSASCCGGAYGGASLVVGFWESEGDRWSAAGVLDLACGCPMNWLKHASARNKLSETY